VPCSVADPPLGSHVLCRTQPVGDRLFACPGCADVATPLLKTKLYIPPARSGLVSRPRLVTCLNQGLRPGSKLTLVSTPAGFGETTLVSD
jgi:hypothetical protein